MVETPLQDDVQCFTQLCCLKHKDREILDNTDNEKWRNRNGVYVHQKQTALPYCLD